VFRKQEVTYPSVGKATPSKLAPTSSSTPTKYTNKDISQFQRDLQANSQEDSFVLSSIEDNPGKLSLRLPFFKENVLISCVWKQFSKLMRMPSIPSGSLFVRCTMSKSTTCWRSRLRCLKKTRASRGPSSRSRFLFSLIILSLPFLFLFLLTFKLMASFYLAFFSSFFSVDSLTRPSFFSTPTM